MVDDSLMILNHDDDDDDGGISGDYDYDDDRAYL